MTGRLAVVVSGFPRRSETFAVNELLALESRGLLGAIVATKAGDGSPLQPGCERLLPYVTVLPPGTPHDQGRALAAHCASHSIRALHAYFAHTPAAAAAHAATLVRLPFGFSAHAKDVRKTEPVDLVRRGRAARCVVACNTDVARDLAAANVDARLLPHGVDLTRFRPAPKPGGHSLRLLAVGRLVPKKGFDVLLRAAATLAGAWSLRIVGDGPERDRLERLARDLSIRERVRFSGATTHDALPSIYGGADIVVVPSVEDRTGDRDGLPNVVLEAMASGRPVVASAIAAIDQAVDHRHTGLLVPPGRWAALGTAIRALASSPARQVAMGRSGRAVVERRYDVVRCSARFCDLLEASYA